MGYLRREPDIQRSLRIGAASYRALTGAEYRHVVEEWRQRFEPVLGATPPTSEGPLAHADVDARLPFAGFLFRVTGRTGSRGRTAFGYEFAQLSTVEHTLLNAAGAVLVDRRFAFACMYTREAARFYVSAEPDQ